MRLSKIKLSGFKTFVEPTTLTLPSNLVGIVGPNGCGKSNVIDAVRWVLGESSAKYLRGESMTASITFDFPQPFGPTIPTRLEGRVSVVGSTNVLKPESLILLRRIQHY